MSAAATLSACSSSTPLAPSDAGSASPDGGSGTDASTANPDAGGGGPLGFTPSNIDLSGLDLASVEDVVVNAGDCAFDDRGLSLSSCFFTGSARPTVLFKTITNPDGSRLAMFVMKSLRADTSAVMKTVGTIPIVLVALETMDIAGSLIAPPGSAGGGLNGVEYAKGPGPGGGTAGARMSRGGGGGSYCGKGGRGGAETGTAPDSAAAFGAPELIPLIGGSAGGNGSTNNSGNGQGDGGGAVQLVAGTTFTLRSGATINVGGGGGSYSAGAEAGGGGSGGSVLIESKVVLIAGTIAANGGGGGGGKNGEDGRPDSMPAMGGATTDFVGGNGSGGASLDGTDGSAVSGAPGSGGGGAAGRVRINSSSGAAMITGSFSPSGTTCVTQGEVKR